MVRIKILQVILIYNMSDPFCISVYRHECFDEYLCTTIQNGLKYCKLLIWFNHLCFQITFQRINFLSLKNCKKVYVSQDRCVSVHIQTLIKHDLYFFKIFLWIINKFDNKTKTSNWQAIHPSKALQFNFPTMVTRLNLKQFKFKNFICEIASI